MDRRKGELLPQLRASRICARKAKCGCCFRADDAKAAGRDLEADDLYAAASRLPHPLQKLSLALEVNVSSQAGTTADGIRAVEDRLGTGTITPAEAVHRSTWSV